MELIKLGATGFAEFFTAEGEGRMRKLRPFKYNSRGEGFARSTYYQPAMAAIRQYHSKGNDKAVFDYWRSELHQKSITATKKWEKSRLTSNVRAIHAYQHVYGNRKFVVKATHRISCKVGPIIVSAKPDLWVEEHGEQVLIKIGVSKKKAAVLDIVLYLIHKAATSDGYPVAIANVVYLDVESGKEHVCSVKPGAWDTRFKQAGKLIAQLWESIPGPTAPAPQTPSGLGS